jgi:hypothetical protein
LHDAPPVIPPLDAALARAARRRTGAQPGSMAAASPSLMRAATRCCRNTAAIRKPGEKRQIRLPCGIVQCLESEVILECRFVALKFAFAACCIVLSRLLYMAFESVAQWRAATKGKRVSELGRMVNWPGSENGDHVVEVPFVNQFRRRPSAQREEYRVASRYRA